MRPMSPPGLCRQISSFPADARVGRLRSLRRGGETDSDLSLTPGMEGRVFPKTHRPTTTSRSVEEVFVMHVTARREWVGDRRLEPPGNWPDTVKMPHRGAGQRGHMSRWAAGRRPQGQLTCSSQVPCPAQIPFTGPPAAVQPPANP
ncbi:hypothetical protein HJG60_010728 [Phyllostomus discolor]|uniref:Uncharacterized protein n=1 Tax=Phyllostomus discolor TaxID=89673 RepID=A0A834EHT0_9CHIR|nr:hypothetical protein HJG60_010728 [Phyllostomus discolor]